MDPWWLVIRTPDGAHAYQLGDPDEDYRDDLIQAARHLTGFPPGDEWVHGEKWDVQLSSGDLHPSLPVTTHTLDELTAVTASELAAYRKASADANRAARVAALRAQLEALHPDDLADVLGGLGR